MVNNENNCCNEEPNNQLVMTTLENLAYPYAKHGNHDAAIAVSTGPCTRNGIK